jgi:uncharacterized repeat protein (TIGR03803 family)
MTLISFCSLANCTDGSDPVAGLVADASGNLLGTTLYGGANPVGGSGGGTVFEIAKTADGYANTPSVLYSFCAETNCTDGAGPIASLIADTGGNLFGTTSGGGAYRGGTVFEIAKTADGYANTPTIVYSFCAESNCTDGVFPQASLLADTNGNLFGTTRGGLVDLGGGHRVFLDGTVFEIAKTADGYANTPTVLYSFCAETNCTDGRTPDASLIADASGNLFGTTEDGGRFDGGTVFEIAKTADGYASTPTILYSFCAETNCTDGGSPFASLIADAAGNLFGTTSGGGAYGGGTVFEIAKTAEGYANTPTILYSFCAETNCTDGRIPAASLLADASGNLYSTTREGGAYGGGTVFEIAKTADGYANTPTVLYSFCAETNCADGQYPVASLIADARGNLFGTAKAGGAYGGGPSSGGTVFEITDSGFVTGPVVIPPSEITTTASGLGYSRVSRTFNGTVTITNIIASPISGPFSILFTGLTAGVTLANATGSYSGSPYLVVPSITNLGAGQSATVGVQFADPSFGAINFTSVIYSGSL